MREGAIRAGGLPALLVVAGVRDHRSLGWAAAEAWLRHGPEHHLLVTVRSSAAQQFAAEQSRAYPGRIAVVSGDWRDPEIAETCGGVLAQLTGGRRAVHGAVHAIARCAPQTFTTDVYRISQHDWIDALRGTALSLPALVASVRPYLAPLAGIVTFTSLRPGSVVAGYSPAMSAAKTCAHQIVADLADALGREKPPARANEIAVRFVATHSGAGAARAAGEDPAAVEDRFASASPLPVTAAQVREAAGQLAVSLAAGPEFHCTTGQRLHVDGGWHLTAPGLAGSEAGVGRP